ncbi:alpha-l-rhamnosidase [Lactobacillus selangorensis]|uniref:alpha-L-rhamnosidase n=1 Tax=Lactobacillus selangorensis TaxID=81857 RepID=A0A0R2FG46_9LACO|nr:alpha-L-rhamnosidase [Lactobacillus selangorensis]KRN27585.1 alpha-l-rhamnosidase [Lactobacillus selangorensis]KRN30142.1 alpha-l-rhamnosidase [Lactobacillus selangorensis]
MQKNLMRQEHPVWTGKWISASFGTVRQEPTFTLADMFVKGSHAQQEPVDQRLRPALVFHKHFQLDQTVRQAVLTITAHGIYQAYLNGRNVTDAILTPDYTDYNKMLQYQTYDVTELLHSGQNKLVIVVADGWYAGRISTSGGSAQFGGQLAALADLTLCFADGSQKVIGTDHRFQVGTGKWRYADIQIGEKQDLRQEYLQPTEQALEIDADFSHLVPQEGPQVKRKMKLAAQKIWPEGNALIVDFGQVVAGRVRLTAMFDDGQPVVLDHSEVLDEAGHFFQNIVGRNKDQQDVIIGRGQVDTIEPDFTFHGFRYVKITGLKQSNLKTIQAIVIFSDMKATGHVTTSNPKINRLLENVAWSQRGNMISIPTDCPQRERAGWTGDMQVFAPASTFYYNTDSFINRWLKNVRLEQQDSGEVIDYTPAPKDYYADLDFTGSMSSAGWGDAIVMVPWTLYQRFDDRQTLQDNYAAMVKWHHFAKQSAAGNKTDDRRYLWDTKFHYGDWMLPSLMAKMGDPMVTSKYTRNLVGTAFLANSARLLGQISDVLGRPSATYYEYADQVGHAFEKYYVTKEGLLTADYQGCYVLALAFGLITDEKTKQRLVARLVELIHENDDCLDTGFLSVPYLLDVLVDNGHAALAKKVFLQEKCPSWLYEVDHGATTLWESWSGIQPDGKVGTFSFNHYAMGCVLDWFIRDVIGLTPTEPGYQTIMISPKVKLVDRFELTYQAVSGLIKISSEDTENGSLLHVTIPAGVTAEIILPYQDVQNVPAGATLEKQVYSLEVGAGDYDFPYVFQTEKVGTGLD